MKLDDLLKATIDMNASDLYLIPGNPATLRVEDKMMPLGAEKLSAEAVDQLIDSLLNDEQRQSFDRNLELNLAYQMGDFGRFRVNIYRTKGYKALVARRVKLKIPSIDELNLPPILNELVMEKKGLVLVVGAVGSGKSTTLAAMIDHRNSSTSGHIITIEDPLEFLHLHKMSLVSQREIGLDTESYHEALKNALRQAPDVIVIGEIRDPETMSAALYFVETGHLVLSTLHSVNAHQALDRIFSFFPPEQQQAIRLQLSLNLKAIISQRLMPRADGSGRIPAVGIMLNTPRISDLIQKGDLESIASAIEMGQQEGMRSLDQAIYDLYTRQLISHDDALTFADSPNNVRIMMRGLRFTTTR